MTRQEAIWLRDVFEKKAYGRQFKRDVPGHYWEAERILYGRDAIDPPSCTCMYRNTSIRINSKYDSMKAMIYELANSGDETQTHRQELQTS
jgi:hypothetical protein